jgi:hypothetical protein
LHTGWRTPVNGLYPRWLTLFFVVVSSPEDVVSAQLAGEGEGSEAPVVLHVWVGVLPRMPQSIAVHSLQIALYSIS